MNFFSPCKWHCARINLEATLWHDSGNLFSSDMRSLYTKISINIGKDLIIFHRLKLYILLNLVQEDYRLESFRLEILLITNILFVWNFFSHLGIYIKDKRIIKQ